MKVWNMETEVTKGNRTTVKMWPTGKYKDQCFRILKSSWYNTGDQQRDHYFGKLELQERIRKLEAGWDAAKSSISKPVHIFGYREGKF